MADDKDREPTGESEPTSDDPTQPESGEFEAYDPEKSAQTESARSDPAADDEADEQPVELQEFEEQFDDDPDGDDDEQRELVGAGAPVRSRTEGGADSRDAAAGRRKKTEATPRQNRADKPKRTSPAQFVREAVGELRKVVYPTGSQLGNYFVVVLVFVLIIIGIVSLLDLGFGWLTFRIFA